MRTLVLCGDRWHSAQTAREGLAPLTERSITFDWIEDAVDWSADRMDTYGVAMLTKANNVSETDHNSWVTPDVEAAFLDYVRRGNGLLVVHSGLADYDQNKVLRGLMGGTFIHHPPQCPVTTELHAGHPLNTGSAPFTLVDEHYYVALDDDHADVFLTTVSEHGQQPGGWTRTVAKGRVCVLTPGHNLDVWAHPSYQALLHNALRWCGKADLNV